MLNFLFEALARHVPFTDEEVVEIPEMVSGGIQIRIGLKKDGMDQKNIGGLIRRVMPNKVLR